MLYCVQKISIKKIILENCYYLVYIPKVFIKEQTLIKYRMIFMTQLI